MYLWSNLHAVINRNNANTLAEEIGVAVLQNIHEKNYRQGDIQFGSNILELIIIGFGVIRETPPKIRKIEPAPA